MEVVERQVSELRSHPHVQQIIQIKPFCYKIVYWPQDINSLYSQRTYQLKLSIPENYPEAPPSITFMDKIFHLNIHPQTGQVFMPVLKDDWSPFLNFKAVITALGQILSEADESYAAKSDMLAMYQDQIDIYIQNVKDSLNEQNSGGEVPSKNGFKKIKLNREDGDSPEHDQQHSGEDEEEFNEEVIEVKDISYNNYSDEMSMSNHPQFKDSLVVEEQQFIHDQLSNSKGRTLPKNKKQPNDKILIQKEGERNDISSEQTFNELVRSSKSNPSKNEGYQSIKSTLQNCKDLIALFSEECSTLDAHLENIKSKRLKKKMEERSTKLEEMIMELFDISHSINLRLMDMIRKDSKKYCQ